ncbi:MAG: HEAT repeat domain-containing protein [Candidatus Brocadiae bacterium]|nr:HEAT repeat domain-containing protein [Candidatus Brocadiia bacterium]
MYKLEYYYDQSLKAQYDLKNDEEIKTVGSQDCLYLLKQDEQISPVHLMLRIVNGSLEIFPIGNVQIAGQILPIQKWLKVETDQPIVLTQKTKIFFKKNASVPETDFSQQQGKVDFATIHSKKEISNVYELPEEGQKARTVVKSFDSLKKQKNVTSSYSLDLDASLLGKTIGTRYQVNKKIGSGAMGDVYEVWDKELQRKVALKIFKNADMKSLSGKRFQREAQTVTKLQHQNIVRVHDVGEYKERPFFTMDLLEGQNLAEKIAQGSIAPREAMTWIHDIAHAVHTAHESKIIHRDIKPSNIIIHNQKAMLTDFGIARDMENYTQLTTAGESLGTPAYMSPEQAKGSLDEISYASDVYSLGCVLYELLTGKPPFSGSPVEVLHKVCTVDPPSVHRLNPEVHHDAVVIATKAMFKEKQYRYANAQEMAKDIKRYLDGEPIEGTLPPFWVSWKRLIYQNKAVAVCILFFALLLLGLSGRKAYLDYSFSLEQKMLKEKYLQQAESARKSITPNTTFQEMMKISELYTQATILGAKDEDILQGKLDLTLRMADRILHRGNLNFAEALYFIAEQQHKQSQQQENSMIAEGRKNIQEKRKQKLAQASQVLEELKPDESIESIKDASLSLLRFQDILSEVKEEYQNSDNAGIQKALDLAIRCQHAKKDVPELNFLEKHLIELLPYSEDFLLEQKLQDGLEEDFALVRILCARLLGLIRSKASIPLLLKRIRFDSSYDVVKACLQSLSLIEGGEEELIAEILSKDNKISLEKLGFCGKWAVNPMLRLLRTEYKKTAQEIILKIGKESVKPLLFSFNHSSSDQEKLEIIQLLGEIEDKEILQSFLAFMKKGTKPEIEEAILKSFCQIYYKQEETGKYFLAALDKSESMQKYAFEGISRRKDASALPKLFSLLSSSSESIQELACKAIIAIGDESFPMLLSALKEEEDSSSKLKILFILASLKNIQALPYLVPMLSSNNAKEVELARKAIPMLGEEAIPRLYQKFKESHIPTCKNILQVVSSIQTKESIKFYRDALQDERLANEAFQYISNLGKEAIPLLIGILVKHRKEDFIKQASHSLGQIGEDAVPYLLDAFVKSDVVAQENLSLGLVEIGAPARKHLIPLLSSSDPNVRLRIVKILGRWKDPQDLPTLLKLLSDIPQIREEVQNAIVFMGKNAIPDLIVQSEESKKFEEKAFILDMFGKIKDERSIPKLISFLEDKRLYSKTAVALKEYGKIILPYLLKEMKDAYESKERLEKELPLQKQTSEQRKIREMLEGKETKVKGIKLCVSYMGQKEVVPYLKEAIEKTRDVDPDGTFVYIPFLFSPFKSEEVIKTLVALSGKKYKDPFSVNCWFALEEIGKESIPFVVSLLGDGDYYDFKIRIIVKNGYTAAPLLIKYFEENPRHRHVIQAVVDNMSLENKKHMVYQLTKILRTSKNIELLCGASNILGDIGHPDARSALERLKFHTDSGVVKEATAALAKIQQNMEKKK